MLISSRIKAIAEYIKEGEIVADVGADHGLLEVYLLAKFNHIKLTAIENKIGPYTILEKKLTGYKNVKLSFSDGLDEIDENINVIVLAGMGGRNIIEILNRDPKKLKNIKKIVLDPHRDISLARRNVVSLGYKIKQEKIVFDDNKYYVISEYARSKKMPSYSEDELEFGLNLYLDELWPSYKNYLCKKIQNVIYKISSQKGTKDRVLHLRKLYERLENYGKN